MTMTFEDAVWIGLGIRLDGELTQSSRDCTAGEGCVHQDKPIIVWIDADGKIVKSVPDALVFDHNGIRHHGCPDVAFRVWLVERGLA